MTWIKLDSGFPDHPKVVAAGPMAAWLYVCGLTYCARYLTDGRIPKGQVRRLSDIPKPDLQARRLVEAGLWIDDTEDYVVHDYTVWQTPSDKIIKEREEGRKRAAASAEARAKKRRSFAGPSPKHPQLEVEVEVEASSSSGANSQQDLHGDAEEEEETELTDEQRAELERRWEARNTPDAIAKYGTVTNPFGWRMKTLADVLENYSEPTPRPVAPPPACPVCKDLPLDEPCPDCNGDAA